MSGHHPLGQRDLAPFHDGVDRDGEGLAAVLALVNAGASGFAIEFGNPIAHDAAAWAVRAIRPKEAFEMFTRSVVVVVDRVTKLNGKSTRPGVQQE